MSVSIFTDFCNVLLHPPGILAIVVHFQIVDMPYQLNATMKRKYPWALSVPDSPSDARCRNDNKIISVKKGTSFNALFNFSKTCFVFFFIEMFFIPSPNLGSSKLAQHEMQDIHIKAARSSVNQSSIVASMSLNDDVETQKLKATFFHVLRIVMDGGSFRSSDPMSRQRSLYSVMFPDSKYTKINCGRTKATYILNHAIAPFARKTLQDSLLGKVFGLFVDESTYHNKVRLEYWVIFFSDSGSRTIRYLSTKELDVNLDVKDFLPIPPQLLIAWTTCVLLTVRLCSGKHWK